MIYIDDEEETETPETPEEPKPEETPQDGTP